MADRAHYVAIRNRGGKMFRWLMFASALWLVIPEGLSAQTSDRSKALAQRVAAFEFEIEELAQGRLVPVGLHSNTVTPVGVLLGRTEMWFVREAFWPSGLLNVSRRPLWSLRREAGTGGTGGMRHG